MTRTIEINIFSYSSYCKLKLKKKKTSCLNVVIGYVNCYKIDV